MNALIHAAALLPLLVPAQTPSPFELALRAAERAFEKGDAKETAGLVLRALERDPKSIAAWRLRARAAEKAGDRDERIYALHRADQLALAQELPEEERAALHAELVAADPIAEDLLGMNALFTGALFALAEKYEQAGRPHSSIRVHKEILALNPEHAPSLEAIQRIAALPDPSLAEDAKPKDLLQDVSEEWIAKHDKKTLEWKDHAQRKSQNYEVHTNAGYQVLVRTAEAMDQMSSFYRVFFQHGTKEHGGSVPRIEIRIFRKREEYLKSGSSPVEWSGGQYTGAAVETYIGDGGFEDMVGTLFHEAAHQFVDLATNAAGWLNEGLASFFEGCEMLPNGTVRMNSPANHRLFPLADRMEQGWMERFDEGIDPKSPDQEPQKAPTFEIVLENRYEWGPPWYAPTWGVVYFLYNYQDPSDGRYLYRDGFREFIDKSGGRVGSSAIKNFEEIVLGNPAPPIKGAERQDAQETALPKTVQELSPVWKEWILRLRDEQSGRVEVTRPYHQWARNALKAENLDAAIEHFEKGLVETPRDPALCQDFAQFLADKLGNTDRATKLATKAIALLEEQDEVDEKKIGEVEKLIAKWDPEHKSLEKVHQELWAASRAIVQRYQTAELPLMVMDVSRRLGTEVRVPGMFEFYGEAARASGRTLELWQLAYNEQDLSGWVARSDEVVFRANGPVIESDFGKYAENSFNYRFMTLDTVTSGDFSLAAEVDAKKGQLTFAGLIFGQKGLGNFHTLVVFPGRQSGEGSAGSGFVDLATFFAPDDHKTWRHNPVDTSTPADKTATDNWHHLRIDVYGSSVDAWFDGEFVASQEFKSREVLRGRLGLMTGPGKTRFRNVRFLSRPANDRAASIERELRMETIRAAGGGSASGSWLGLAPPFPVIETWVQEPRTSWSDVEPGPQLLVFASITQNDLIPIHEWLNELTRKHKSAGLRTLTVFSPNDKDAIGSYLDSHVFPGSIGVDARPKPGIGQTFETYFLDRFNLPRIILIDLNGKVVWEGDPGFRSGQGWRPGLESYLDDPLGELIEKRNLVKLQEWLGQWRATALPALREGNVGTAFPVLAQAREFPKGLVKEVDEARSKLDALEVALDTLTMTSASLAREEREPALEVLVDWSTAIGKKLDRKVSSELRPVLTGAQCKGWKDLAAEVDRFVKRSKKGVELEGARELLTKARASSGRFPKELADELDAAIAAANAEAVAELLKGAGQRPTRWLVSEFFNW